MRLLIVSFIYILLVGCTNEPSIISEPKIIHLNPEITEKINTSDIISEFKFVKLKTPDNIHFGDPDKVLIVDDKIYVLDKFQGLKLLVFDINGNFIFDISNYGRGPGEFVSPNDFIVDNKNKTIAIFDQGNIKISFYDINDGKFIEDKKLEFWTNSFEKTREGYVFFNNNLQDGRNIHNVYFTDYNLNIIKSEKPIPPEFHNFHYGLPRNFTNYDDKLYLTIPFDNTVYSIEENNSVPKYVIDFGNLNIPENFFSTIRNNRERIQEVKNFAYNVTNYYETHEYIFFNYSYNNSYNYFFQSKTTSKKYHISRENLVFDLEMGPMLGWPVEAYQNYLIWYQQPFRLKSYVEKIKDGLTASAFEKYKHDNKYFFEFYDSINENDNAYLIFTKINF